MRLLGFGLVVAAVAVLILVFMQTWDNSLPPSVLACLALVVGWRLVRR